MRPTAFVHWSLPSARAILDWWGVSTADSAPWRRDALAGRAYLTSRRPTCGSMRGWGRRPRISPAMSPTWKRHPLLAQWVCHSRRWLRSCAGWPAEVEDPLARRSDRFGSTDSRPHCDAPYAFPATWLPASEACESSIPHLSLAGAPRALGVASYPHSVYSLGISHNI